MSTLDEKLEQQQRERPGSNRARRRLDQLENDWRYRVLESDQRGPVLVEIEAMTRSRWKRVQFHKASPKAKEQPVFEEVDIP